MPIFAEITPG